MRCLSCQNLSFKIICKNCQDKLLSPSFYKRELQKDFYIYSFYKYDDISDFLNSKYHFFGDRIFKIFADLSFKKFALNFEFNEMVYAICVDDHTRHQFSHTAILSKALKSKNIKPIYNTLKAKNIVKYAGRDLEYRKKNKRDFKYSGKEGIKVILVDDIITTGSTILEAKECLEKKGCEILFALTISDAQLV